MKQLFDFKMRPIKEFDVVKVFHFIGARKKRHYIYKHVKIKNGEFSGDHLEGNGSSFWLKSCADENGVLRDFEIVQRAKYDEDEDL